MVCHGWESTDPTGDPLLSHLTHRTRSENQNTVSSGIYWTSQSIFLLSNSAIIVLRRFSFLEKFTLVCGSSVTVGPVLFPDLGVAVEVITGFVALADTLFDLKQTICSMT